ncbi:MAG: hypothetical protein ABFD07_14080 [Methanobacterium sp.]
MPKPNQSTCWRCGTPTEYCIYKTKTGEFRTCEKCEEELNK